MFATALALFLLVVGGTSYAAYSLLLFVVPFCPSLAMRRTRSSRDASSDSRSAVRESEKRREKEMKAEAGGYGGSDGGL